MAAILVGGVVLGSARPATAAKPTGATSEAQRPDLASAKKHYSDGEKKFKAGDYAGALGDFQTANDIKATAQAERYIGKCQDALGHLQEAVSWYDKFLDHVPEKMATEGDEIRKRDADIKALPGKVHIESNPAGANVAVDGKPLPSPAPTDTELPPGSHTLKLTAPGRLPTEKTIDVAFASSQNVSADLDPEPAPAPPAPPPPAPVAAAPGPPPPPPPEPRSKIPAFVTGGLAVAAAGVGTVFGVLALNDKGDFNKNPTTQTADNGDTHALIADMAFGIALTFGVTSAVLFFSKDDQPAAPPPSALAKPARTKTVRLTPTPWVTPHAGGAGFQLQF